MKTVKMRNWPEGQPEPLMWNTMENRVAGHACDVGLPVDEPELDRKTEKLLRHLRRKEI